MPDGGDGWHTLPYNPEQGPRLRPRRIRSGFLESCTRNRRYLKGARNIVGVHCYKTYRGEVFSVVRF